MYYGCFRRYGHYGRYCPTYGLSYRIVVILVFFRDTLEIFSFNSDHTPPQLINCRPLKATTGGGGPSADLQHAEETLDQFYRKSIAMYINRFHNNSKLLPLLPHIHLYLRFGWPFSRLQSKWKLCAVGFVLIFQ